MRINKTYYNTSSSDIKILEKARDDSFVPITETSNKYKHWIAQLDFRTCLVCRANHGMIYQINELVEPSPPIHKKCRCQILEMQAIHAGNATNKGRNGADFWLKYYGKLPDYYISSHQMETLGYRKGDKPSKFAPGKMLGRDLYENRDGRLPQKNGRIWYEADINYTQGRRNLHRIMWSNDGLIFVTYNHGKTFYEII